VKSNRVAAPSNRTPIGNSKELQHRQIILVTLKVISDFKFKLLFEKQMDLEIWQQTKDIGKRNFIWPITHGSD
jgi:hypothetical protein